MSPHSSLCSALSPDDTRPMLAPLWAPPTASWLWWRQLRLGTDTGRHGHRAQGEPRTLTPDNKSIIEFYWQSATVSELIEYNNCVCISVIFPHLVLPPSHFFPPRQNSEQISSEKTVQKTTRWQLRDYAARSWDIRETADSDLCAQEYHPVSLLLHNQISTHKTAGRADLEA